MFHHRVSFTAVVTAALFAVASPGAASAKPAAATHVREVCAPSTYVTDASATSVRDTLYKGEKVDVSRYSPSGARAYGMPRGAQHAHLTGGWVKVADLCRTDSAAKSAAKSRRYSVKISPGGAGVPVYVGGISNITVKDAQRAGQRLQLCITPAPTERPSCRSGRTGRTIDTIAWSQAGPTKVRIAIEGGPVIVKTVNVRPATH